MYLSDEDLIKIFTESLKGNYIPLINIVQNNISYNQQGLIYGNSDLVLNILKHSPPENKQEIVVNFLENKNYDFISINELSNENKKIVEMYWNLPSKIKYEKLPVYFLTAPFLNKDDKENNEIIYTYWNLTKCFGDTEKPEFQKLSELYPYIVKNLFDKEHTQFLKALNTFYTIKRAVLDEKNTDQELIKKYCYEKALNNSALYDAYNNIFGVYTEEYSYDYLTKYINNKEQISSFITNVFPNITSFQKETFLFLSLKLSPNRKAFQQILNEGFSVKKIQALDFEAKGAFYKGLREHKDKKFLIELINSGYINPMDYNIADNKFIIQDLVTSFTQAEEIAINQKINREQLIKDFLKPVNNTNETFFSLTVKDGEQFFSDVLNVDFTKSNVILNDIKNDYPNRTYNQLEEIEKFEFLTDFLENTWFSKTEPYKNDYFEQKRKDLLICESLNRIFSKRDDAIWVLNEYINLVEKLGLKNSFVKEFTELICYQFGEKSSSLRFMWNDDKYLFQCERIIEHLKTQKTDWIYIKEKISYTKDIEKMRDKVNTVFKNLLFTCLEETTKNHKNDGKKLKI